MFLARIHLQPSRWDPGACRRCHGTTTPPRRPLRRSRRPRTTPTAGTSSTTACSHSTPPPPPTGKSARSQLQIPIPRARQCFASKKEKKSHGAVTIWRARTSSAANTSREATRISCPSTPAHSQASSARCQACGGPRAGTGRVDARTHALQRPAAF